MYTKKSISHSGFQHGSLGYGVRHLYFIDRIQNPRHLATPPPTPGDPNIHLGLRSTVLENRHYILISKAKLKVILIFTEIKPKKKYQNKYDKGLERWLNGLVLSLTMES